MAGEDVEAILSSRVEAILEEAEQAAAGIRDDAQQRADTYLEESRLKADEIAKQRIRAISDLTDALVERLRAVAQQSDELIAALDDADRRVSSSLGGAGEVPATQPLAQAAPPMTASGEAVTPGVTPQQPAVPGYAPPGYVPPGWQGSPPPIAQPPPPYQPPVANPPPIAQPPPPYQPPVADPYRQAPPHPPQQPIPQAQPTPQIQQMPQTQQMPEGGRLLATQMMVAGSSREEIVRRLREEFGVQDPTPILQEIGL